MKNTASADFGGVASHHPDTHYTALVTKLIVKLQVVLVLHNSRGTVELKFGVLHFPIWLILLKIRLLTLRRYAKYKLKHV